MVDLRTAEGKLTSKMAGVDFEREEYGLQRLLGWTNKTLSIRRGIGEPKLDIGYFANVIEIGHGNGLAITTDGVGSKLLVAQMMHKYDTVGIDCVAMNVNDILCVGAEPLSMVDCISLEEPKEDLLEQIGKGLYEGCIQAGINLVGGEIAQVRDMVKGKRRGYAFDLTGTCVGLVPLDRILIGQDIKEGDVVVGLRSSGIHSNGMAVARKSLLDSGRYELSEFVRELNRTLGEELLEPTRIYVTPILEMVRANLRIKALAHITSDGFLNLTRVKSAVGYVLDSLPDPPPVFRLIQQAGNVPETEMFRIYNMGIGFCVIVDPGDVQSVINISLDHGYEATRIGYAITDKERRVKLEQYQLIGYDGRFHECP